jgi:DNA-directed RNA polymerase II subunit RPB11
MAAANRPERSDCFLLDEDNGEKKIEYLADTKVANSGQFTFNKEDHTLGNLLRHQLLRDPRVRFTGYMLPHPLIHKCIFKVQTTSSTISPEEVVSSAIDDLKDETDYLSRTVADAIEQWKKENATGDGLDQF